MKSAIITVQGGLVDWQQGAGLVVRAGDVKDAPMESRKDAAVERKPNKLRMKMQLRRNQNQGKSI